MKNKPFENFDFIDFWDDDEYAMNVLAHLLQKR